MICVTKKINGQPYLYLVRKGRKNGKPTNVETFYLGKPDRLAATLGLVPGSEPVALFPVGAVSREIGASAALWCEAQRLGLVDLIDDVLEGKARRSDSAVSYGELLVALAIQRAIAPRALKSVKQLRSWYERCGLRDFLPLRSAGLDARRADEALSRLRSADLEKLDAEITRQTIKIHDLSLETLSFDATNFDSYAAAGTSCCLLKRGNAKSKKKNLRVLGLGMMVTADGGVPLLSFVYPGNKADVTSFKSFLRRVKARGDRLPIDQDSTIAFDGGNISADVVKKLGASYLQFVARLPHEHAPEASAIPTRELPWLGGSLAGKVRAKKVRTQVYGIERTVVATFSESMRQTQLPGLKRDIRRAKRELAKLDDRLQRQAAGERHQPLTVAQAQVKATKALDREHLPRLFRVEVSGNDAAPALTYEFGETAWNDLYENHLGRTLILTSRDGWSADRIVRTLRSQSHVEDGFRQMKDEEWAASTPLRHYRDCPLRVHGFTGVLGLRLSTLLVRRLRKAGLRKATVSNVLRQLSEVRATKLRYSSKAPPGLKALAKRYEAAPDLTAEQSRILKVLKSARRLVLGTPRLKMPKAARAAFRRS
ncbi:MAG: IS1634 family transposase [Thermodesulfobacteriota bacterium]